jgi:hypothetical protein
LILDILTPFKARRESPTDSQPEFVSLHEIRRHSIHTLEILEVTLNVLGAINKRCENPALNSNSTRKTGNANEPAVGQAISAHILLLQSLQSRARANHERLSNETNLAYNTMAQRESISLAKIAEATRYDSSTMKSIALISMTFLPAMFLSVSRSKNNTWKNKFGLM